MKNFFKKLFPLFCLSHILSVSASSDVIEFELITEPVKEKKFNPTPEIIFHVYSSLFNADLDTIEIFLKKKIIHDFLHSVDSVENIYNPLFSFPENESITDKKINDKLEILKMFKEHDLHIKNFTTIKKETAMHYACKRGITKIIGYLAEEGLSFNSLDNNEKYPLDIYCSHNHPITNLKGHIGNIKNLDLLKNTAERQACDSNFIALINKEVFMRENVELIVKGFMKENTSRGFVIDSIAFLIIHFIRLQ